MAKKSRPGKPGRPMSKRQLSRWQELKRRQLITFIAGTAIILAVLGILGAGWFVTSFQPLRQTLIRVNNVTFDMQYFIEVLRLQAGDREESTARAIANNLPRAIEQDEMIRQAAAKLGVSVSNDEITKNLSERKVLRNDRVIRDITGIQLLVTRLKDEYFDKQVPAEAAQVNMQAMLLETEQQANDVRSRLEKGESFGNLAKDLSVNPYSKSRNGDIGWHPQEVLKDLIGSAVPGDYAFGSPAGTLSQPRYDAEISKEVGYWLVKVHSKSPAPAVSANVSAMLLGSLDEARSIRARLQAGEDFAAIAVERSQLSNAKDNGGALGLVNKGYLTPAAEEYIFNQDTRQDIISDPIRDSTLITKGGYWLINVLEKADSRALSQEDRDSLKQSAFNQWASSLWLSSDFKIEEFIDESRIDFAISRLAKS